LRNARRTFPEPANLGDRNRQDRRTALLPPESFIRAMLLCLLSLFLPASGIEEMQLRMERLQGKDLQGSGMELDFAYGDDDSLAVTAAAERLQIGDLVFEGVSLDCPVAEQKAAAGIDCDQGGLSIERSPLGKMKSTLSVVYRAANDQQPSALSISFESKSLSLDALKPRLPDGWTVAGRLSVSGRIRLQDLHLLQVRLEGRLAGVSWSSADGLQVGEDVALTFSLSAEKKENVWKGNLDIQAVGGQLYSDPLFVELGSRNPMKLAGAFAWNADGQLLEIRDLDFRYANALDVRGQMKTDLSSGLRIRSLDIDYGLSDLQQAYQVLLQPLVIGTPMDDVRLQGKIQGRISMVDGELRQASADLSQVELEHGTGMFGITGLEGNLDWKRRGAADFSHLSWRAAHLYKIAFGAADALLQMNAGSLRLQPLSLPLLGGNLMLHDLEVDGLLQGSPSWETRADLDGIQLLELSRSLEWPDMLGQLQASIPRVHYQDSLLNMQGQLQLDVFGGEVVVDGMQLQDPLGVAPVLQTSLRFSNLDLEQITQVFSFGRIEGSLEGQVRNLQLVGWEIAGFDADLHSPARDRRAHRISQRAIDNLTELGNGASVQLSATMLRFFEDFAYDKLALRVKLHGTIAELDGVPRPKGGYYIVKGARLPRIDVIGRNHRIAWKELLSRIREIRFDDMIVE